MLNRRVVVATATVVTLAAAAAYFGIDTDPDTEARALTPTAPVPRPAENTPVDSPSASQPTTVIAVNEPLGASVNKDAFRALAAENLYAAAEDLYRRGGPGSFAVARMIALECGTGMGAMHMAQTPGADPLQNEQDSTLLSKRLRAKDQIAIRCGQVLYGQFLEPRAEDKDGVAFAKAIDSYMQIGNGTDSLRKSLEELARNQQLFQAIGLFSMAGRWEGEPWTGDRNVFNTALQLAALRASSTPEMAGQDIRTMVSCYRHGMCDGDYSVAAVTKAKLGDEQLAQIERLARPMEAALRRGDVTPFFRKGSK